MTDKFRALVEKIAALPTIGETAAEKASGSELSAEEALEEQLFDNRNDLNETQANTLEAHIVQARETLASPDVSEDPHAEMKRIMAIIGASVARHSERFLKDLQLEIQHLPGADVAFVTRDITWLNDYSYLEDRPELTPDEIQAAICQAAAEHEEGAGTQDGVTHYMDEELDRIAPRVDDDPSAGK